MANAFDQFDNVQPTKGANPFDQFDGTQADFAARMSADFSKRKQQLDAVGAAHPMASDMLGQFQRAGVLAGGVGDVAGNAIGSAARYLPQDVKDAAQTLASKVMGSEYGQDFSRGAGYLANQYGQFEQAHPDTARTLGAVGNIASLLPIGKGAEVTAKGAQAVGETAIPQIISSGLDAAGNALVTGAESRAQKGLVNAAQKAVSPNLTVKQAVKQGVPDRIEQGFWRSKIIPDAREAAAADQLAQLEGFKPSNTAVQNYKLVNDALDKETGNLRSVLENSGVQFAPEDYQAGLLKLKTEIEGTKGISDATRAARLAPIETMMQITNGATTPSELLSARQELDRTFFNDKGILPASAKKVYKDAIAPIRDYTNSYISTSVPDAAVKDSLAKQSALITATNNLAPKAAKEGIKTPSAFSRTIQKIDDAFPGTTPIKRTLEAASLGLPVAAAFSPVLAPLAPAVPLAIAGRYGIKALTSPTALKMLGKTLQGAGYVARGGADLENKLPKIIIQDANSGNLNLERAFQQRKKAALIKQKNNVK